MKAAPVWWTAADQAELDAAIFQIIDGCYEMPKDDPRRGRCWDLLDDWLCKRRLLSKAQWLRRIYG